MNYSYSQSEAQINNYRAKTDWELLKVLLFHLLKNAIKHGSKGSEIEI